MASLNDFHSPEPIWHELVEEVDHLPVYISTPGRRSCCQGYQHRVDGLTVSAHWHEYVEFLWLREGHLTAIVQADTYEMEPGDLLVINSGELHMTRISQRNSSCPYVLIQLSHQCLGEYFPGKEGLRFTTLIRRKEMEEHPVLLQSLSAMQQLFEGNEDGYQLLFRARFCEFLHAMYKHHSATTLRRTENATTRDLNRVMDTVAWVQGHFREPLSLEDAAEHLSISKEYFCRIFKKYTGQTFLDYLCMIRTTRLYEQLQSSDLSIPVLMEQNGLTNYKTFLRTFRCLYGTTPQKMRQSPR
ncbi:MAG: helix-turn-helix domain-containing protein [Faecousia sp.]